MAEDTNATGGMIPPKQSPLASAEGEAPRKPVFTKKPMLRRPGETISAPAVPVPPPAAVPPASSNGVTQGIPISREAAAKKMTARINLATATQSIPATMAAPEVPSADDSGEQKTIKLRAPAAADPVQPNAPSAEEAPAVQAQAAKSKTSRISLETALSDQPDLPPPAAPKTIRLKRPTEMGGAPKPQLKPPTTHVTVPANPAPSAPAVSVATPPAAEAEADSSTTRKKTIKVKRPGPAGAGPKISINKDETGASGEDNLQALSAIDSLSSAQKPDKVNPIFLVAAVIGILAVINLIWIFAAQLYGPNAAVADFAALQGPSLPNPIGAMVVE